MAKFKVGDKVQYWVFDEKVTGTIKAIRGDKAEVVSGGEKVGLTYPIKDLVAANSACSRNAVVANALNGYARNAGRVSSRRTFWNACGTARNASGRKVKVAIKSITDKGIQTFEKIVDVDGLESWMRSAGLGGEYQHVLKQLAAMGVNEVSLSAMSKVMIADV